MEIDTARLTLREFTKDDLSNIYRLESIPQVARYQTWEPRTESEAQSVLDDIILGQSKTPRQHIELAVIVKSSGAFIGRVGCMTNKDKTKTDMWFALMPSAQGNGYATEAVKGLINHSNFDTLLEIECDPRNSGSWKLAERLGFLKVSHEEKAFEIKGEWCGSVVYHLQPRPES